MKLLLELEGGSASGTRYEVSQSGYRAVGRDGIGQKTVQMAKDWNRALDPEELERVETHLTARRPSSPGLGAGEGRIGAYRRGRDILLDDDKVSRVHAMFFFDEDGASVVDLMSTNGTHVNGRRVSDAELHHGDRVHVGKTCFLVVLE